MIFSHAVASTPIPLFSLSFIFICLYFPLNNLPHLWLLSLLSGPFLLTSAWSTFLPWASLPFKTGIYLVIYLPPPCEIPLPCFHLEVQRHWYYRVLLFPINRKTLLCSVQPAQSPWSLFLCTGEYHSLWNYPKTPVFSVAYITHFWVNCVC